MKLVFFIYSLSSGGAERVLAGLANCFASQGVVVEVLTVADSQSDFYPLAATIHRRSLGLAGESCGLVSGLWSNVCRVHAIRRALAESNPDVVISFMTTANVLLALASIGMSWRTIGSERCHPPEVNIGRLWSAMRAIAYRGLDSVVAQTESASRWLLQHTSAHSVSVIPNSVEWPLEDSGPVLCIDDQLPDVRKLILAVGRLERQKGFDLLIRAFVDLAEERPDWDLVILGEGVERLQLEVQANNLLGRRIHLPGRAGNMAEWYMRADIFVLPSRFEGFPNTLLEAMAAQCAVIAADCPTGPSEIIVQHQNGVLVPREDASSLQDGLTRLIDDQAMRERLGQTAGTVRNDYAPTRIFQLWMQLLKDGVVREQ